LIRKSAGGDFVTKINQTVRVSIDLWDEVKVECESRPGKPKEKIVDFVETALSRELARRRRSSKAPKQKP
jgi:hypothetical protein